MSSLGFQIAWQMIQSHAGPHGGARVERFFIDTLDLGSLESAAPLADFDLLFVSAAYEMDGPNILDLIEAAGLPLEARARANRPGPLVIMGGVLVSVNRLPLYPFIDVFAHGEAEVILPPLLDRALEARRRGLDRRARAASGSGRRAPGTRRAANAGSPEAHVEQGRCTGRADRDQRRGQERVSRARDSRLRPSAGLAGASL
jgi:radical SAM superfamily enzyme YgiQ (UPF0313 family)